MPPMGSHTVEITIMVYSSKMRGKQSPGRQKLALTGNVEKGIEVALDVERLVYEVNTLSTRPA
jgi:hypothetical protein